MSDLHRREFLVMGALAAELARAFTAALSVG